MVGSKDVDVEAAVDRIIDAAAEAAIAGTGRSPTEDFLAAVSETVMRSGLFDRWARIRREAIIREAVLARIESQRESAIAEARRPYRTRSVDSGRPLRPPGRGSRTRPPRGAGRMRGRA